jgi:hypothetical protein
MGLEEKGNMRGKLQLTATLLVLLAITSIILLPGSTQAATPAPEAQDLSQYEWPMFHYDLAHTGYSDCPAPNTANVLWKYKTNNAATSSPSVADGRLFIGSHDHYVYCLNATTGDLIWKFETGNWVYYSSPAIAYGPTPTSTA